MIANSPIRATARLRQSIRISIYSADDTLHILLLIFSQSIVKKKAIFFVLVVLGRQSVAEAGKEFLNHAIGEGGHVNSCRIV